MTDLTETPESETGGAPTVPNRPDSVPEKFWDPEAGEIRVEALTKSYCDLERRMGRMVPAPELPEAAEGYEITLPDGMVRAPDVDTRLFEAEFTGDQVQLVYDLAAELLGPLQADRQETEARDALIRHFGGVTAWHHAAADLRRWGKETLPEEVYGVLTASADGIKAMHAMMSGDEPRIGTVTGGGGGIDKAALRKLMDDPRYWRDGDPELVARVRDGFSALQR